MRLHVYSSRLNIENFLLFINKRIKIAYLSNLPISFQQLLEENKAHFFEKCNTVVKMLPTYKIKVLINFRTVIFRTSWNKITQINIDNNFTTNLSVKASLTF